MLVSIIIPTKNRCDLLRETLASVVAQTYGDWEAIVVDDGSTDGTKEMVWSIALTEKRVRFLSREQRPSGASACRNIGVSVAHGEYIIFLDSDDLLAPSCLEYRVKVMEDNPKLDFAVFLTQGFYLVPGDSDQKWESTEESDLDRLTRLDTAWQTMGPLWRKSSLARIGAWDERALSAQDWEFHMRALATGLSYRKFSKVDSFWRLPRHDSITYAWTSPARIWNRVLLLRRIIGILRAQNLITKRRRRLLAAVYYRHAFTYNDRRNLAYKIWNLARREKIVGNFEFLLVMASDFLFRLARRANNFAAVCLFPELSLVRISFAPLPPKKHQ